MDLSLLDQTLDFLCRKSGDRPDPAALVILLLGLERQAKQTKRGYTYGDFRGTWQLGFVTGTKQARQRGGVILGAGRFLPSWVRIELVYQADEFRQGEGSAEDRGDDRGQVINRVQLGGLVLALTGPAWLRTGRILAFDFTRMTVQLWGLRLFEGWIRGGAKRDAEFEQQSLKEQAFFSYFWVDDRALAARGRGGGLALWTKVKQSEAK